MAFAVESLPYGPSIFVIFITFISMAYKKLIAAPVRILSALRSAVDWEAVRGFCLAAGIIVLNGGVVVLVLFTDSSFSPG